MTLNEILAAAQPLVAEMNVRFAEANPSSNMGIIDAVVGRKYVRLMRGEIGRDGKPYMFLREGFIDPEGNILFGNYYGPYKYASAKRGNIFDPDQGFGALASGGLLRYL